MDGVCQCGCLDEDACVCAHVNYSSGDHKDCGILKTPQKALNRMRIYPGGLPENGLQVGGALSQLLGGLEVWVPECQGMAEELGRVGCGAELREELTAGSDSTCLCTSGVLMNHSVPGSHRSVAKLWSLLHALESGQLLHALECCDGGTFCR